MRHVEKVTAAPKKGQPLAKYFRKKRAVISIVEIPMSPD